MTDHTIDAAPATSSPQVQESPDYVIEQVTVYRDSLGRVIEALSPYGMLLAPMRFMANATVMIDSPVGPRPMPLQIPLTAANVPEAFAVYDAQVRERAHACAAEKMRQLNAIAEQQRMAAAGRIQIPR